MAQPPPPPPADLVIRGGVVLTMVGDQPLAEGVAIRGSEIVAVGDDAGLSPLIGPDTVVIDIDGRAVVPGFVDAHSYGSALSNGEGLTDIQDHMLAAGATTMGEAAVDEGLLSEMQRLDGEGQLRVRSSLHLVATLLWFGRHRALQHGTVGLGAECFCITLHQPTGTRH